MKQGQPLSKNTWSLNARVAKVAGMARVALPRSAKVAKVASVARIDRVEKLASQGLTLTFQFTSLLASNNLDVTG